MSATKAPASFNSSEIDGFRAGSPRHEQLGRQLPVTTRPDLRIVHLIEAPAASATLARWFVDEWTPYYGLDGPGDAARDLAACNSRDTLPLCQVALNSNGTVLGTAALKSESVGSELGVGPWLATMPVGPAHRDRVDRGHRGGGPAPRLPGALHLDRRRRAHAGAPRLDGLRHRRIPARRRDGLLHANSGHVAAGLKPFLISYTHELSSVCHPCA